MEDTTKFEDADSYSFGYDKDRLQFKDIILQHLKKISLLASVEFRGGFWQETPHPNPNMNGYIRTYIPDSRECYSNSVECFADMLFPYFDNEMKKVEEQCTKGLEEAHKKHTTLKEQDPYRDDETKEEERRWKKDNSKVSYRSARIKICRSLFRGLCSFLFRKKYLEVGSIED